MQDRESSYPQDWFTQGARDFERVKKRLAEQDWGDAAFHLQQALEKYLKGYLLSKGWQLRRTHNLQTLLDEATIHDATLERFRFACQEITAYYFLDRYPFFAAAPSADEIESARLIGQELIRALGPF
ncbi:MAG: HEPN domain-containing protein [Dehalococcoidia bacterium]|nr:HEPN domain-containing protein [Dehalococcoidia bacterium]